MDPAHLSPESCSNASTSLVLRTSTCTPEAAAAALQLDPGLERLDLTTREVDATCLVSPGTLAKNEGATAEDLHVALISGQVNASLRVCADVTGNILTPCSQPHRVEFVGDWLDTKAGFSDRCVEMASSYTGRDMDAPGDLKVVVLRRQAGAQPQEACSVMSDSSRMSSVFHIGG
ncbi:hypothetical protein BN12_350037 [Nostocoides japonicum T1-X7]|uniref:Uncharacterized protein n=1 Tax=Nostocoides japonicum T1-X7 TaxID=1194083 RepID=A0A077LYW6_9MICO|nr:hypothetical protein BN12_350037 [Tetrasphaera japonica T1-X7]